MYIWQPVDLFPPKAVIKFTLEFRAYVIIFRQVQKLLLYCSWSITPYGLDFSLYKTFQNVVCGRIEEVLLACRNKLFVLWEACKRALLCTEAYVNIRV